MTAHVQYYTMDVPPTTSSRATLTALYSYLVDGVEAARDMLFAQLDALPPDTAAAEQTYQLLTRILNLHTSRHPAPAALPRDVLEQAITAFPSNTSFLSLYLYGELGRRVQGRVQTLVAEMGRKGDPVGLLWCVWAEGVNASRTFWTKGGAERVRMVLDQGINSAKSVLVVDLTDHPEANTAAALWMLYIDFELIQGRHEAAKQLCYRAVNTLGGCKGW